MIVSAQFCTNCGVVHLRWKGADGQCRVCGMHTLVYSDVHLSPVDSRGMERRAEWQPQLEEGVSS